MKDFIEKGYEIKSQFDYEAYNQEKINILENLF